MHTKLRSFRPIWSKSRFLKSQSKKNDDWFRFARIDNNLRNLQKWKTKRMRFHSLFVFIIAEKKRKDCQIHFHLLTNNFHSFSLIQYHQINHKHSQSITMRRGKGENEHHQQPSNKSKPHLLTRAWREGKQTTLTQLPAFPAFCKCNEHPITSNAHWYPSGH